MTCDVCYGGVSRFLQCAMFHSRSMFDMLRASDLPWHQCLEFVSKMMAILRGIQLLRYVTFTWLDQDTQCRRLAETTNVIYCKVTSVFGARA